MELKILNKEEYLASIPSMNELFMECFQKNINKNYLKWRYLDNPLNELIVAVAIENEKIIANYSVSPCIVINGSENQKTALSMTTMTHPCFAGKGIFTKLATIIYEEMAKKNYSAVWGFPNHNSHSTFINRLGWEDIYEIPVMKLDLSTRNINLTNSVHEIIEDNNFLLNYSSLYSENDVIRVKKDQEYFRWRYTNNPINKYKNYVIKSNEKVLAHIVIKNFEKEFDIIDINFYEKELVNILLNYVVNLALQSSIKVINTWAPRHNILHNIYEKYGFRNSAPITYFSYRNFKKDSLSENYNNWYIQMGDSDVY